MVDIGSEFWKPLSGNYIRTVYNTIINPQCAYKEAATQNRRFTTMDMFQTTMAALRAQIDGEHLGFEEEGIVQKFMRVNQRKFSNRKKRLAQRNKIKLITILFLEDQVQFSSISSIKAASVSPAN